MKDLTIKEKIIAVFISDYTSYKIAESTGIAVASISQMRSGKRKIDNITVKNAQRIIDLYEDMKEKDELPSIEKIMQAEY